MINTRIENMDSADSKDDSLPRRPFMLFVYDFFLALYVLAIRVYGTLNKKAGKWIAGRMDWKENYARSLNMNEKRIWFHCSSVGEYEQAKPVIEALKQQYPSFKIVVTFFSPSGFEACKKTHLVDYILYLPPDSKRNALAFINIIKPSLTVFVKYEFWYHYLAELKNQKIPAILVSGAFRPEQPFFKWYGGLFRDMLSCFSFFFLQDEQSAKELNKTGIIQNITVSGDTRYDRVAVIAENSGPIPAIENFKGSNKIFIAGSSWPADEEVLHACLPAFSAYWKIIIAPHETDPSRIRKIQKLFGSQSILYSELDAENTGFDKRILIINNIGLLSRLYACGDIAFVGGGFYKGGIHNILEPAVFGVPVIFGPVFQKFVEAKEMAELGIVFPINDKEECLSIINKLINDESYWQSIHNSLLSFMKQHTGATSSIMSVISSRKWLD